MRIPTSHLARAAALTAALLVGSLIVPGAADDSERPQSTRAGQTTASQKYGWAPALFDFGWEYGESLTDNPERGTELAGDWIDASNGSGRAARHNGGLMLASKYGVVAKGDAGPGDHGTTTLTLHGNPQTYGRWELRSRTWEWADSGPSYRIRYSLVPAKDTACTARSITIAEFSPEKSSYTFGVFTPNKKRAWRGSKGSVGQGKESNHAYAVEVGRDHITWFVDANPVGTVKTKAAIPKVPLTLQLSLMGGGQAERPHTYVIHDWIRGFPIGKGKQVRTGPGLKAGKHSYGC